MTSAEHPAVYEKEGHSNFVTESDLAVQRFLISGLSAILPESCFFAEEQKDHRLTEAPTWVIDPIDGTLNFMHQRRTSAISVALLYEKTPRFAWIYDPYQQRMYQSEKGKGAFCNGHRLAVSQYPFEQALVGYGTSPYDPSLAQKGAACALSFLQKADVYKRQTWESAWKISITLEGNSCTQAKNSSAHPRDKAMPIFMVFFCLLYTSRCV